MKFLVQFLQKVGQTIKTILNLMLLLLLIYLAPYIYWRYISQKIQPKPLTLQQKNSYISNAQEPNRARIQQFLAQIPKGTQKAYTSSQKLYLELETWLSSSDIRAELLHEIEQLNFPVDHKYFFKTNIKNYIHSLNSNNLQTCVKENIIYTTFKSSNYAAEVFFNPEGLHIPSFVKKIKQQRSKVINRFDDYTLISAAYTSNEGLPVGLTISHGKVINPALKNMDGLLIITKDGRIHLQHIDDLRLNFDSVFIRKNYHHYRSFLNKAQVEKLTIIQGHLLIYKSKLVGLRSNPDADRARRRIIFMRQNNDIYIYESGKNEHETFFEVASKLRHQYNASSAFNLDMGGYNLMRVYNKNQLIGNYSKIQPNIILSNLLMIRKQL